ncbi:MAG: hypothetical protein ACQCXQ_11020, partial [Verrucomicrobiales bacterium]
MRAGWPREIKIIPQAGGIARVTKSCGYELEIQAAYFIMGTAFKRAGMAPARRPGWLKLLKMYDH